MESGLETKIQFLKGIGPKLAEKMHKLGIETIRDLIFYWPRTYLDYTNISSISQINSISQIITIQARIIGISNKLTSRQRMKVMEAMAEDGSGTVKLIWFNQPFLAKLIRPGSEWIFRGKIDYDSFNQTLVMESPTRVKKPCIIPVYPTTAGLSSAYIARLIESLKLKVKSLDDFLPEEIIKEYELVSLYEAITKIHTPVDFKAIDEARKRLAFDELFLIALRSRLAKDKLKQENAPTIKIDNKIIGEFVDKLPYELTGDQKKAVNDILSDIKGTVPMWGQSTATKPMNRLLNGDVGSGKTVVAAIAAFTVANSGYKVLLMVPTEVLASQHFETFSKLFTDYDISVGLLTSNIKKVSKSWSGADQPSAGTNKQVSKTAKTDPSQANIIIGTHALLQKNVNLENVGLVIVDEQHRFGVKQRALLKEKTDSQIKPHFLSMTATPIPRTLHLALFGDLDISVISEKPKNRKEIKTRFVEPQNRLKAYDFIRAHVKSGRQIFVICPLIEEKEGDELGITNYELWDQEKKSVMKEYNRLNGEVFPEYRVAMLHGKMKSKEKEEILSDFYHKKYDILVSTSVIEVGIDVPNATIMMIEDAEHFGLAQIHQFRGRVGRGEHQSFCFLFSNSNSQNALVRLHSLENVSDGFKLAEIDLEMRGPGDVFGTMQSGQLELKMAAFSDKMLIEDASKAASELVKTDAHLDSYPTIRGKLAEFEASKHME